MGGEEEGGGRAEGLSAVSHVFYICTALSLLKLRGFSFQILFPGPIQGVI